MTILSVNVVSATNNNDTNIDTINENNNENIKNINTATEPNNENNINKNEVLTQTENNKIEASSTTTKNSLTSNNSTKNNVKTETTKQTVFSVPNKSVIRGKYFITYLKDKAGTPIVNALVKITYKNKNFNKRTNVNGRVSLKITDKVGKYKIKLAYNGGKYYLKTSKKITIKLYNSKTKIVAAPSSVLKGKYLIIYLKDKFNRVIPSKKVTISIFKKKYKKTTNKEGKVLLKLNKVGTHKIKVSFAGSTGYLKVKKTIKVKVIGKYAKIIAKSKTMQLNNASNVKYSLRLTNLNGIPLAGEKLTIKTKCNNFTKGTGRKITKKTIVLSSDSIQNKATDKKLLNDMAKILRAKGYKVIVSGIGPNYHVSDVKKYSNVCVFSLVGGIDSGMFVDMASSYYQYYLKKNNNQFVLGCVRSPSGINLANRIWLKRAHDDDYSPDSFKGLYFPGQYLNKKTHVDYVYGGTAKLLVKNFLKYAKKGKSIGMSNTKPGAYKTYKVTTSSNGYASIKLPKGTHTIISRFSNNLKGYTTTIKKTYVTIN